jgi:hypothetical protein
MKLRPDCKDRNQASPRSTIEPSTGASADDLRADAVMQRVTSTPAITERQNYLDEELKTAATVYNTIKQFTEAGILRQLALD